MVCSQALACLPSELRELSRYIAALPGELKTVPEPRLHTAK